MCIRDRPDPCRAAAQAALVLLWQAGSCRPDQHHHGCLLYTSNVQRNALDDLGFSVVAEMHIPQRNRGILRVLRNSLHLHGCLLYTSITLAMMAFMEASSSTSFMVSLTTRSSSHCFRTAFLSVSYTHLHPVRLAEPWAEGAAAVFQRHRAGGQGDLCAGVHPALRQMCIRDSITVEDVTRELEKRHVIDHKVKQERMQ